MVEVVHEVRKKLIEKIDGNVTYNLSNVPVYNFTPKNQATPFIRIYTIDTNEINFNISTYILEVNIRIDVVTSFDGDAGGELQANQIMSQVLTQTRTRTSGYIDLSSNSANVISVINNGVRYIEQYEKDKSYVIANLDLQFKIELL
tara:strand:+ start:170 stop:607 length:438 start_codon:yes stop_codon:yes gene_type:complete